jgi:hypothetical protein
MNKLSYEIFTTKVLMPRRVAARGGTRSWVDRALPAGVGTAKRPLRAFSAFYTTAGEDTLALETAGLDSPFELA